MAKLRPTLQVMETDLGYTVNTLDGVADGCLYSDLSPVSDCPYNRTEREYHQLRSVKTGQGTGTDTVSLLPTYPGSEVRSAP
jgi:hypothetical protein